jgi:hypothetical protein
MSIAANRFLYRITLFFFCLSLSITSFSFPIDFPASTSTSDSPTSGNKKYFKFSPLATEAYQKAIALRFGEAYALMAQMRLVEPDNLIVFHIENYIDFFQVYISEEKELYDRLKKKVGERLDQIESGDPNSPYYLYIQADIRLQWALAKLRFEDYLSAFSDVSKAYHLLRANESKFPSFMPNKKDLGILHAMVGTIPDGYKWGAKLLGGLSGTIEQGKKEIEIVLTFASQNDFIFEQETQVLYAFLLLHLNNDEDAAWEAVNNANLQPALNPLHCFIMANIAMRTGRNGKAIDLLTHQPKGKGTLPFPYLDYMLGLGKLRRLDHDATPYFLKYIQQYKGRNFVKEAYQKLAWQSLINNDLAAYRTYMLQCEEEGYDIAGGDKNALREAKEKQPPKTILLKARLLFDGGYYDDAYHLLTQKAMPSDFKGKDELEYYYRLGRVCHGQKKYEQALYYYDLTVKKGLAKRYYYACNAALQKGLIYEQQQQYDQAEASFEICLSLKPDEYRVGLHQKAKSGLSRIKR